MTSHTREIKKLVTQEIEALHRFFVSWLSGSIANDSDLFQVEFTDRFHLGFVLIAPGGNTLDLNHLSTNIRNGYGQNRDFRIAIRDVVVRFSWDRYVLATYQEWQRNALASTPPDNGRAASVVFQIDDDLKWLHIHETWLPAEVMRAGPFDF